jgi:hypothetical protein
MDDENIQMNCTDGIHAPNMKQKKNHQVSSTVFALQSFYGNFGQTYLLVTHT